MMRETNFTDIRKIMEDYGETRFVLGAKYAKAFQ